MLDEHVSVELSSAALAEHVAVNLARAGVMAAVYSGTIAVQQQSATLQQTQLPSSW
jgi:hypothetical protein